MQNILIVLQTYNSSAFNNRKEINPFSIDLSEMQLIIYQQNVSNILY